MQPQEIAPETVLQEQITVNLFGTSNNFFVKVQCRVLAFKSKSLSMYISECFHLVSEGF